MKNIFYTYIYLNPLKPGRYTYGEYVTFLYEPFYVGKGCKEQLNWHLKEKYSTNKHKFRTIQKVKELKELPVIFKLIDFLDEKCAFCYEKFLVDLIGRRDLGTGPLSNLRNGGTGGCNPSKEIREKISKSKIGKKDSYETKLKKSISRIGDKNPMFNKTHTEETIEKIKRNKTILRGKDNPMYGVHRFGKDAPMYGKHHTQETKNKIKNRNSGNNSIWFNKHHSQETKNKISLSKLGNKNPMYGISLSGDKNGMFNKCFINNLETKEVRVIKKEDLENYLTNGWKKGKK